MKLNQFSKATQAAVVAFAKRRGIRPEEVVARFERLYAGRGPGRGGRRVFA